MVYGMAVKITSDPEMHMTKQKPLLYSSIFAINSLYVFCE